MGARVVSKRAVPEQQGVAAWRTNGAPRSSDDRQRRQDQARQAPPSETGGNQRCPQRGLSCAWRAKHARFRVSAGVDQIRDNAPVDGEARSNGRLATELAAQRAGLWSGSKLRKCREGLDRKRTRLNSSH